MGLLGDVARGIGSAFTPYSQVYMRQLLEMSSVRYSHAGAPVRACRSALPDHGVGGVGAGRAGGRVPGSQSPNVQQEVKPHIFECFGDIALAIETAFLPYLPMVMPIFHEAGKVALMRVRRARHAGGRVRYVGADGAVLVCVRPLVAPLPG